MAKQYVQHSWLDVIVGTEDQKMCRIQKESRDAEPVCESMDNLDDVSVLNSINWLLSIKHCQNCQHQHCHIFIITIVSMIIINIIIIIMATWTARSSLFGLLIIHQLLTSLYV